MTCAGNEYSSGRIGIQEQLEWEESLLERQPIMCNRNQSFTIVSMLLLSHVTFILYVSNVIKHYRYNSASIHHCNIWKLAKSLIKVKAVANNEFIRNLKANIISFDYIIIRDAASRLR